MKDTKKETKLVPKLRFRDFTGQWLKTNIGNLLSIGSGKDYKHLGKGDIPVYGTGGYMTSVNEYLYNGESVCIGRKGTIDKPVLLDGKFWTVDTLFYTHSYQMADPKFVYALFSKINWYKYNEASGVPSLSKATIEKIPVYSTDLEEQQKIASFLTAVDKRIEQLTKKKKLLEEYKKGVMQKIFNQEIRFKDENGNDFPEWESVRLGEIFSERTTRDKADLELLSVTQENGIVKQADTDYSATSGDKSGYKLVQPGDIAYNSMRMWQGASGVSDFMGIVSPAYTIIYTKISQNMQFWGYLFKHPSMINEFRKYSQGLTSDTWNLKYPLLSGIKTRIPTIEEQAMISNFLKCIDIKIDNASETLLKAITFKKGLLQQMFI